MSDCRGSPNDNVTGVKLSGTLSKLMFLYHLLWRFGTKCTFSLRWNYLESRDGFYAPRKLSHFARSTLVPCNFIKTNGRAYITFLRFVFDYGDYLNFHILMNYSVSVPKGWREEQRWLLKSFQEFSNLFGWKMYQLDSAWCDIAVSARQRFWSKPIFSPYVAL